MGRSRDQLGWGVRLAGRPGRLATQHRGRSGLLPPFVSSWGMW